MAQLTWDFVHLPPAQYFFSQDDQDVLVFDFH